MGMENRFPKLSRAVTFIMPLSDETRILNMSSFRYSLIYSQYLCYAVLSHGGDTDSGNKQGGRHQRVLASVGDVEIIFGDTR